MGSLSATRATKYIFGLIITLPILLLFDMTIARPEASAASRICFRSGYGRVCMRVRRVHRRRRHYRRRTYRRRDGRGRSHITRGDATIQQALNALGYDAGRPDGRFGPKTKAAIKRYQTALGQPRTGDLTIAQKASLLASYARGAAPGKNFAVKQTADRFLASLRGRNVPTYGRLTLPGMPKVGPGQGPQNITALCSRVSPTQPGATNAATPGFGPASGASVNEMVAQQFCLMRSHILAQTSTALEATPRDARDGMRKQCELGAREITPLITKLAETSPVELVSEVKSAFPIDDGERGGMIQSAKICIGLGLAYESYDLSLAYAGFLVGLKNFEYGEVIAGHLIYGLGVDQNIVAASSWYAGAAEALYSGAQPIVSTPGVDRGAILAFIAQSLDQGGATSPLRTNFATRGGNGGAGTGTGGTGRGQLPVFRPLLAKTRGDAAAVPSAERKARSFLAVERYRASKLLPAVLELTGLDEAQFGSTCAQLLARAEASATSTPTGAALPLIRLCRAASYVRGDKTTMGRFDRLLAGSGDPASRLALGHLKTLGIAGP